MGAETDLSVDRHVWVSSPGGIFALWAGVLTGPIVWAADLVTGYALAPWACGHHDAAPLHLLSVSALLGIGLAVWASSRGLDASSRSARAAWPAGVRGAERIAERAQFMARLGLASSALFAIAVAAMEIPRWVNLCG